MTVSRDLAPGVTAPLPHRALYAAFDRFPSTKGAGVHIGHASGTLFDHAGGGLLYVLGGRGLPPYQLEDHAEPAGAGRGPVEIVRFGDDRPNFLARATAFSSRLAALVDAHGGTLEIAHGRDPWGVRALLRPDRRHRVVYEVNSLPSIELPVAYPALGPATIGKLDALERHCAGRADAVVTVSEVLRERLVAGGVDPDRITLIPNGADVPTGSLPRPDDAPPGPYIAYVGALQRWQGVDVLLRAMTRLADLPDLRLVVLSATPEKRARPHRRLAARLGVDDRIDWRYGLRHDQVPAWLAHATLSVAPLTDCPRNVDQGCCPLKVLESMAAGTPVVASDLPVVRELLSDGEHGRLVPPDRPADLARAIRVLIEHPDRAAAMGVSAQSHVARHLTWRRADDALREVYRGLDGGGSTAGRLAAL